MLLLGLALTVVGLSQSGTAYGAPKTHLDATATDTPTDTPSATATTGIPPSLTLAVPSSGQGPVGVHVTVIGSNWGVADVLVGAAAPGATCDDPNTWVQTFNHVRPQADQSIIFSFDWPTSLAASGGAYSICASNSAGTAHVSYQLLAVSPPTFDLDARTTKAGSLVTMTGTNFVGLGSVTLTVTNAQGNTRTLTTLSPDGSGNFKLQYQPRPTDVGDIVLQAFTGAPQGMQPAIQLSAKLHVDAAPTPTVAVTPTTVVVATPTPPAKNDSSPLALIITLVVGIVLLLLAIVGAILFFVMRNRNQPPYGPGDKSGYYGGSNSGYGGSGPGFGQSGAMYGDDYQGGYGGGMNQTGWEATPQSGYPGYDPYNQGGYPPQPGYGGDPNGWPESDEPDPGWRPRPMTGQWRSPDDYPDAPYGVRPAEGGGPYPPQDPWASPDDSYGQTGQTDQGYGGAPRGSYDGGYDGGGYDGGGYDGGYDGGGYPPMPQPNPGDWGGSPGGPPPQGPRSHQSGGQGRTSGGFGRSAGGGSRGGSSGGPGRNSGGGSTRGSSGGPGHGAGGGQRGTPRDTPRERYPEQPPEEEW